LQITKEIDINFIREAGQVCFVAPLLIAKLTPRFVKNSYSSSLILKTGAVSQKPVADWSVAASYLSGLHAMTRNLAIDLKPICMNLVSPGTVNTELWGPNRESLNAQFSNTAFMGRVATVDEVAESYVYLMKDTNATSSTVSMNGGVLL
jgi:NAD(P)-dependent dehydrogenase (short-subunit alcohol dehydrogenase family)